MWPEGFQYSTRALPPRSGKQPASERESELACGGRRSAAGHCTDRTSQYGRAKVAIPMATAYIAVDIGSTGLPNYHISRHEFVALNYGGGVRVKLKEP